MYKVFHKNLPKWLEKKYISYDNRKKKKINAEQYLQYRKMVLNIYIAGKYLISQKCFCHLETFLKANILIQNLNMKTK